eukprot:CAMPEP_0119521086 /NCGR_PEP_ID=MMETSP1344-20130328/36909_1 /TAXON_ID=236787 /ORGANISM="Florenciella parvula, Strain CCMP2471" /LENGTH=124 /DNA_ID=CAMNT_0007559031 /DNA_START=147 /DNA_END=519 /DNA_ORIENTATION=+
MTQLAPRSRTISRRIQGPPATPGLSMAYGLNVDVVAWRAYETHRLRGARLVLHPLYHTLAFGADDLAEACVGLRRAFVLRAWPMVARVVYEGYVERGTARPARVAKRVLDMGPIRVVLLKSEPA